METGDQEDFGNEHYGHTANELLEAIQSGESKFMDVSDYEDIIDYLHNNGKLKKAFHIVDYAIHQHPYSISLQTLKAQCLLNSERFEEAIAIATACSEIESSNPEIHYILGTGLLATEQIDKAFKAYKKASALVYENPEEMNYKIGIQLEQVNLYDEAIEYLHKALHTVPDSENIIYEIAFCYERIGDNQEAIKYYNRYLDIDPFSEHVWYNLGIIYNRMQDFDKAIDAYDYSISINEKYASAFFNRANSYANNQQIEEAIDSYKDYLKIEPDNDEAFEYIADCYFHLADYAESFNYFRKAIRKNKKNANSWFGAALILVIEEKIPEALVFLQNALEIDYKNSEFWITEAKLRMATNDYEKAELAFENAVQLDPENTEYWSAFATFYVHYDQLSVAIDTLRKAIAFMGESPELLFNLSGYLFLEENWEEAEEALNKAMELDDSGFENFLHNFSDLENEEFVQKIARQYRAKK